MSHIHSHLGKRPHSATTYNSIESNGQRPVSRASTTSIQSFDHHSAPTDSRRQSQFSHEQFANFDAANNSGDLKIERALLNMKYADSNGQHGNDALLDASLHGLGEIAHMNSHHGQFVGMQNGGEFGGLGDIYDQSQHIQNLPEKSQEPQQKKKRGSQATATNDRELRDLLASNMDRPLKDVAIEVVKTERTPRSERTKQLFAMLWIRASCKKAKTSVPRNRVYSYYATRCGLERVIPLNPASFGKLVRVMFPDITTRRLGVRGESKYHYVDLALIDDNGHHNTPEVDRAVGAHSRSNSMAPSSMQFATQAQPSQQRNLPVDAAVFPIQEAHTSNLQLPQLITEGQDTHSRIYADPLSSWGSERPRTSVMYAQKLKFLLPQQRIDDNVELELPDIFEYVPSKTDKDAAYGLAANYRTHCTNLMDSFRYCKPKMFNKVFKTFMGNMTVPLEKVFHHPDTVPWIKECDWRMYQKMIRFIAGITFQTLPHTVTTFLKSIAATLHTQITHTFQKSPNHVLEAKLEPASLFAHLLHRSLITNESAHTATAFLQHAEQVNLMWGDWTQRVNVKRIMESELPGCGYENAEKILTNGIRDLLVNENVPQPTEGDSFSQGLNELYAATKPCATSDEGWIDRIIKFVDNIPALFPQASARTLLACVSTIGTAALREITANGGSSFQAWWAIKMFIDEMCLWFASLGGFLEHRTTLPRDLQGLSPLGLGLEGVVSTTGGDTNNGSRYSSLVENFGATNLPGNAQGGYQQAAGPTNERMIYRA
ncbi:hypothetical protein EJ05DRAFT_88331 [Pseudovirgaria hyperparasitica]|uniref:RFX-type winged-helix domain-containing protein n=1 Tax=Pseudovirgaria hyperparasitica TaxID=470096 RepID=A0A6A6W4T4_9PEZI|nr:uncharacterized protein EJ05DRAFT_88331 [Pseudovirgaria hyperparasitica]KAF2756061.1 hypothetical protein EJ05DRAFT_88331 [Pseudovirgaria hyperparasitica]